MEHRVVGGGSSSSVMLRRIHSNLTSVQNQNEIPYYWLTFNLMGEELKPDNISVSLLVSRTPLFRFPFPLVHPVLLFLKERGQTTVPPLNRGTQKGREGHTKDEQVAPPHLLFWLSICPADLAHSTQLIRKDGIPLLHGFGLFFSGRVLV